MRLKVNTICTTWERTNTGQWIPIEEELEDSTYVNLMKNVSWR